MPTSLQTKQLHCRNTDIRARHDEHRNGRAGAVTGPRARWAVASGRSSRFSALMPPLSVYFQVLAAVGGLGRVAVFANVPDDELVPGRGEGAFGCPVRAGTTVPIVDVHEPDGEA